MASATRKLDLNDVGDEGIDGGENDPFDQPVVFENIKGDVLVPLGEYQVRNAPKIELKMSKANQPKVVIKCTIQGGEFDGVTKYFDFSWAQAAQPRSKTAFIGMGLPENFDGSLRQMAAELADLEYFAIFDVEESGQIDERTQRPYPPKNKVVSTSQSPQTA
jgi:hypothetical protein